VAESFSPVAEARRLAAESPGDRMLPCPFCAASLKAENFDKHFDKVHSGEDTSLAVFSGSDHGIGRVLIVLGIAIVVQIGLPAVVPPSGEKLVLGLLGVEVCIFLGLLLGMVSDKLPATLQVDEGRIVVRYAFGLLRRSVTFPPRVIEVGSLWERRSNPGVSSQYDYGGYDVKTGTYLRLRDDAGGVVTIGAKTGTGLRKHWEGWTQGGKRKMWDIHVSPSAVVAVEYLLASRGLLTPRAPKPD
jgi:hypothetical protein